jgi:outer membrane receptor protein involved in Fe transport
MNHFNTPKLNIFSIVCSFIAFFSFLLIISASSEAQNRRMDRSGTGKISGTVIDSASDNALGSATVIITKSNDSVIVSGALTDDDGSFLLEKVPFGMYTVKFNFIGYQPTIVENLILSAKNPAVDLGTVKLIAGTVIVDGIEVTADREDFQMGIDKKVFNVEKSITSIGGSATDVLKNIPTVSVDIDGNVSLRGNSNVTVLIDGKPSGLTGSDRTAALDQIPASSIGNVEIITNPSAKFDPDGLSGIINILMKKNNESQTSGSASLTAGTKDKYNANANFNYRSSRINLGLNYSFRLFNMGGTSADSRENFLTDSTFYINQTSSEQNMRRSHLGKLSMDYFLDKRNTISLSATYNNFKRTETQNIQYNDLNALQNLTGLSFRNSGETGTGYSTDLALDYKLSFKNPGQYLTADVLYSGADRKNNSNYYLIDNIVNGVPVYTNPSLQNTYTNNTYNITTVMADYVHPIHENSNFQAGYKSIFRNIDNDFNSESYNDTLLQWTSDVNLNNHFIYNEQIHAVYGTYSNSIKDFSFQIGIRAEQALTKFNLINTNQSYSNNYFSIFPGAHILQKLGKDNEIQLSYTRRINRPNTRQLNPFIDYEDPLNLRQGNPYLKPEYIDAYELSYAKYWKKSTLTSSVYYRQINDMISRIQTIDTTGVSTTTYQNLNKGTSYGFEVIARTGIFDWWNLTSNFNFYRTILKGTLGTSDLNSDNYSWSVKIISNITLWDMLQIQVSGNYDGPRTMAQGKTDPNYDVDMGIKADLFNNKAVSIGLNLRDVFNSHKRSSTTSGIGFIEESSRRRDSRVAMLTFTYKFGNNDSTRKKTMQKDKREDQQQEDEEE